MSKNLIILISSLIIVFWCVVIIYFGYKGDTSCDELVTLNSDVKIEAIYVNSYNNGMTTIKTCDGDIIRMPSINIKMVEVLNDFNKLKK